MKTSKRWISFLLALVMVFGMIPLTALNAYAAENATEVSVVVTRAQWLQTLVKTFSMTVEADNYPDNYFSDLSSESEYYYDMLLAVEFGVVDIPAGGSLRPEEPATREFAATTMNFCLGFQADPETELNFRESAEVADPYDIQIAIDRGITKSRQAYILDAIRKALEADDIPMIED